MKKIKLDITELWAVWAKGRATGSAMARSGIYLNDLDMGFGNNMAMKEMHKDIANIIGKDEYIELAQEFGTELPENFMEDDL